jgi:hypothetical protein
MYFALVLETEGFEFLIDTRELWQPARVYVRRGPDISGVWLDEDDVSFMTPSRLRPAEPEQALALVRAHLDDLLDAWCSLKDDVFRGRLGRNLLVE